MLKLSLECELARFCDKTTTVKRVYTGHNGGNVVKVQARNQCVTDWRRGSSKEHNGRQDNIIRDTYFTLSTPIS